ncbi:MAG: hypothetical protein IPO92_10420 [Saprospiraceae bacterium]|nr:hypothetical protein [Saprospiraceae bacterium]
MKKLFLLLFLISLVADLSGQLSLKQSIFKDAREYIHNPDSRDVIIFTYSIDNSNKFIPISREITPFEGTLQSSASSIFSDYNVSKPADILARILVKRAKRKLAINFFNHFSTTIRDKKLKDLQVLFFHTYHTFDLIGDNIYDYENYIKDLRFNLHNDFKALPVRFKSLLSDKNSQIGLVLEKKANLKYIAFNSLTLLDEIKNKKNIGKAISDMNFNLNATGVDRNLMGTLSTVQLFSEAFKNHFDGNYWISEKEIDELLDNKELLKVFLGLVAAKANDNGINFNGTSLYEFMNAKADNIESFNNLLLHVRKSTSNINNTIAEHTSLVNDDDKIRSLLNYYHSLVDLFEISNDINSLFLQNDPLITKFNCMFQSINSVLLGVETADPTTSMLALVNFLTCIDNQDADFKRLLGFIKSKATFISEIQKAETTDELVDIIDKVIAPIGSWRDKRIANFNMAFDTYVGGTYLNSSDSSYFAISTPVGLSMSAGLGKWGSLTILGSILDIGPLTAFRFRNTDDLIAKIYLKELYSPGIHVSYGIGKSFIFNINGSWQKFTSLQSIDGDQNKILGIPKSGYTLGASINVPLFTLINKK